MNLRSFIIQIIEATQDFPDDADVLIEEEYLVNEYRPTTGDKGMLRTKRFSLKVNGRTILRF